MPSKSQDAASSDTSRATDGRRQTMRGNDDPSSRLPSAGEDAMKKYLAAPPPPNDVLERDEELRLAVFGPDYFNGVKWGALLSGFVVLLFARKLWTRMGLARARFADAVERNNKFGEPTAMKKLPSIWSAEPFTTVMFIACTFASVGKLLKFLASRGRYNEFLWDEYFAEMRATPEEREQLQFLEKMRDQARKKEEDEGVLQDYYAIQRHRKDAMPTYWDGFTVGVLGSLQDAYNPLKPVHCYKNFKAGKIFAW